MNLKSASFIVFAALAGCISFINTNSRLGEDFLPSDSQYDLYTAEFDIPDIQMKIVDSLSGFSSDKIVIGAIRDERFGLTTRGCALTLVPAVLDIDMGSNPEFKGFHFSAVADTTSVADKNQQYIIQNVNVYELTERMGSKDYYARSKVKYDDSHLVTKGQVVYSGQDSLSFDFSEEFGKKYMNILEKDLDSLGAYLKKFPGIYITVDEPRGIGGRIDKFNLKAFTVTSSGSYYSTSSSVNWNGNLAELKFRSTFDGVRKDTSLLFYFSPSELYNLDSLATTRASAINDITQYAFNTSSHESDAMEGPATDRIYVEGGTGLKPMIPASSLRKLMREEISKFGDPDAAIITKATIELPFIFPEDYTTMYLYPKVLSPTARLHVDKQVAFASLSDANISTENQGQINRSTLKYTPDITLHAQQLIRKAEDDENLPHFDVWFLIMDEEVTTTSSGNDEMSDYYRQMAYYSYYNSLYGGGYGGYGGYGYGGYGYGGGGYGYNNYMYLSMMMMGANSSSSSTTTQTVLDKDDFYNAVLVGPTATDTEERPKMKITFGIPRD